MRLSVDDAQFESWQKKLAQVRAVLIAVGAPATADLIRDLRREISDSTDIKDVPYA